MKAHIKFSLLLSFLLFLLLVCCPQSQINAKGFFKDILSSSAIKKGKQYKSDGDYISAIKEFTKSIKREPENLEAYYQLGLIFEDIMHDYDKAISLYKNVGNLSKGLKPTGTEEELNAFNSIITNARTSIDRAIKKKFDSIEKPKISIYIMVKPYKKILNKPEMFSASKYKTASYANEFKLLNFNDNWYQVNVPSIGSGWINGKDVLKIIQKEKEAIETSPAGKAALYERSKDLYPDFRFATDAKDKADSISYEMAKDDDTINSYSAYLKNNPNGKYSKEAKLKIDKYTFEDESFINSLDRLKDWARKNPENDSLEKAKARIDELTFAQAKLDNNTKSLELYITENPQGKYISEARQIIEELNHDKSKFEVTVKNIIPNPVIINGTLGEFRHGTFPSPPIGEFTHVGVDLIAPCASDVYAFADGRVKDVIDSTNDKNYKTLGYMVLIEHPALLIGKKFYTLYLHMQSPPEVGIGDSVTGGSTVIGKVGDTGKAFGCHTHFEIRYFPGRISEWNNIYGPGDQRNSEYLKQNWENPLTFFKKYPTGLKLAKSNEAENNTVKVETVKDNQEKQISEVSNATQTEVDSKEGVYIGDLKDGKKHGRGTFTYPNGNKYVGEWKDDKRHGQGTLTWSSGNEYVGEFKDGTIHGEGTKTWSNGNKYIGEWKDYKMHGQGTKTWPNGNKYVGEWRDGMKHGQGTLTWSNGVTYVGGWKDGKVHGQGTSTGLEGRKYVGEWEDGKKHGQGTITWPDGAKYVGAFKDSKINGYGTKSWPDGREYVGEWKGSKMHGQGAITWSDGKKYVGEWKDGYKEGQGTKTWSDGVMYIGEWKEGEMHGQGTITWPDGARYVGDWKDDKKHGQGTKTWSNGEKYIGIYKNGKMHGQGTYTWPDGKKYVGEWKDGEIYDSSLDKNISNSSKQTSVYSTKNSRTYHMRNCSELNTNDIIEFDSPQKADSAGAIPCKRCNPSAVKEKISESGNIKKEVPIANLEEQKKISKEVKERLQSFSIKGLKLGMSIQQARTLYPGNFGIDREYGRDHRVKMEDGSNLKVDFIEPGAYTKKGIIYEIIWKSNFQYTKDTDDVLMKLKETYGKWSDIYRDKTNYYYVIWDAEFKNHTTKDSAKYGKNALFYMVRNDYSRADSFVTDKSYLIAWLVPYDKSESKIESFKLLLRNYKIYDDAKAAEATRIKQQEALNNLELR